MKVNGEILTKTDLETRQVLALRQRTQQMNDEELRKAIAEFTPDLLVDSVDEMLLLQRGKELGYKVTDEQFKRVLENIRKENKLEYDDQFTAALKQEGMTIEAAAQEPREADDHQPGPAGRGGRQDRHLRRRGARLLRRRTRTSSPRRRPSRCANC